MCIFACGTYTTVAIKPHKCHKVMVWCKEGKLKPIHYDDDGRMYDVGDTMIPNLHIDVNELDMRPKIEAGVIYAYDDSVYASTMFDLYRSCFRFKDNTDRVCCLVECEIPRGAVYWKDRSGRELASTKLTIKRIIEKGGG